MKIIRKTEFWGLLIFGLGALSFLLRLSSFSKKSEPPVPVNGSSGKLQVQYISVSRDLLTKIYSHDTADIPQYLNYLIYNNDVMQQIISNKLPDYKNAHVEDDYETDFSEAYQKGNTLFISDDIACILIRQIGNAPLQNLKIDFDKINLSSAVFLFDNTDIGTSYTPSAFTPEAGKHSGDQIAMNTINGGEGLIVPLFITHLFVPADSLSSGGWRFATDVAYVPLSIKYQKNKTDSVITIPLDPIFSSPMDIE